MPTRAAIRQEVRRRLGGRVVTTSATSTTVLTIAELINVLGDDNALLNAPVLLPSLAAADQQRLITAWDDSTGQASVATLSGDPADAITVEISERNEPTPRDIHDAINRTLREMRHIAWYALPTVEGRHNYLLRNLTWLRSRADIKGVFRRDSPNLLANGDFGLWNAGASAAPTGWVLAGSGGTIARSTTTVERDGYAAAITRSGTNVTLTQTIGLLDLQLQGQTVNAECLGFSANSNSLRLALTDGVSTTSGSYHAGNSRIARIQTGAHTVNTAATTLDLQVQVNVNEAARVFGLVATEGSVASFLSDYGDSGAAIYPLMSYQVFQTGVFPRITLTTPLARGEQLLVASLIPWDELSAETENSDAPLEAIVAGTITRLATQFRRGVNQSRWQALYDTYATEASAWTTKLAQSPLPEPQQAPVLIRGA